MRGLTLIDEFVSGGDVFGFGGEEGGLFEEEGAVEEIEGLERRGAAGPARADLAAIGHVEGGEDGVGLHPQFERVDHAAVVLALEVAGLRDPVACVVGVRFKQQKTRTAGSEVDRAGGR